MKLKKELGQHLLVAKGVLERIASFLEVEEGDVVLEIGPGTGNLTRELLKKPLGKLHLLEVDSQMIEVLQRDIKDSRIVLHRASATTFDFCSLEKSLKVIGNLPYNVASLILENTVLHHTCIPVAVYMLQKEVAEKVQKGPSWLSTFVRTFYHVEYLMSLPARFFRPPPKVQSGLIRLNRRENPPKIQLLDYKAFLTGLYAMRRKAIKNKLPEDLLLSAGIDPMLRVEALEPEKVLMLYNLILWRRQG